MPKDNIEGALEFVNRCLTDAQTGKLILIQRDQKKLRKGFAAIGRDVRRPFEDEEDLLHAYFRSLDKVDFLLLYEQLRLIDPDIEDPLDDLSTWTDISQRACLAIRILAKLNLLRADSDHLAAWIRDQFGEGYMNNDGLLAFEDEARMLEFDKLLVERIRETTWLKDSGTT